MSGHENEAKEQAREHKGTMLDSYTLGTPKEGAWKTYFNTEEENKKELKDTKAYKLKQLKKAIDDAN